MVIKTYIIEQDYIDTKYKIYSSRLLQFYLGNFSQKKIGVLDIETTGLSPSNSAFILGGLLVFQEDGVKLKQYFAEDLREEKETLQAFLKEVAQLDVVITYNGKHFDIKFLKARMIEHNLWDTYQFPYNLDLYLVLNGHSSLRKILPNLKQKTVENFMGLWHSRTDEISGAESVELYRSFLATKSTELREIIMLHNRDDVLQLSQLLPILEKADIHKAFFSLGFPLGQLSITKIAFEGKELRIWGTQRHSFSYSSYGLDDCPCYFDFDRFSGEFYINIPIIKKSGLTIVDTKAFYRDFSSMECYENFSEGFIILKQKDIIHHRETNHFIILLLERLLEVIQL